MLKRSFHWVEKSEREMGWQPDGSPEFDPGHPIHVAHDTLEHFSPKTDFRYELLAFGSQVFGRMWMETAQARTAADDLAGFLMQQDFNVPAPSKFLQKRLKDKKAEHLIELFTATAVAVLGLRTGFMVPPSHFARAIKNATGWIRLGYWLANRRWKGNHALLDQTFEKIYGKVGVDYREHPPKPGDRLVITVNEETGAVQFRHPRGEVTRIPKRVEQAA